MRPLRALALAGVLAVALGTGASAAARMWVGFTDDPTYRFDDLDELVRNAQRRGLEVLITIWGTPSWANDGRGPQYAPKDMSDLRDFAEALSSRYSGRYAGYPFVRFFGIWNESNLSTFLRPQF